MAGELPGCCDILTTREPPASPLPAFSHPDRGAVVGRQLIAWANVDRGIRSRVYCYVTGGTRSPEQRQLALADQL